LLQAAIRLNENKNVFHAKKAGDSNIDLELVQRCRKGERKAQFELYQLYKDRIFNIAYRMANSKQDAEDITQMAFVRVWFISWSACGSDDQLINGGSPPTQSEISGVISGSL